MSFNFSQNYNSDILNTAIFDLFQESHYVQTDLPSKNKNFVKSCIKVNEQGKNLRIIYFIEFWKEKKRKLGKSPKKFLMEFQASIYMS